MNKLNIVLWKDFFIKDIFITELNKGKIQVPTGIHIPPNDLKNGGVPKISASKYNNGIVGYYISNNKKFKTYNNFISVSFLGTVFYHNYNAFLDMKVHCLKPINISLNQYTGLFLTTIINNILKKMNFINQISSESLSQLIIKLPIDNNQQPNWEYMENFMKKIETLSMNKINYIKNI